MLCSSQRAGRFRTDLGLPLPHWKGWGSCRLTSAEVGIAPGAQDRHEASLQGSFVSAGSVCYFLQSSVRARIRGRHEKPWLVLTVSAEAQGRRGWGLTIQGD